MTPTFTTVPPTALSAPRIMTRERMAETLRLGRQPLTLEHFRFLEDTGDTSPVVINLKAWIREEILPSILRNSGYILPYSEYAEPEAILQRAVKVGKATADHIIQHQPEVPEAYEEEYGVPYGRTISKAARAASKAIDAITESSNRAWIRNIKRLAVNDRKEEREERIATLLEYLRSWRYCSQLELLAALPFPCTKGTVTKWKQKAIRQGLITEAEWNDCLELAGIIKHDLDWEEFIKEGTNNELDEEAMRVAAVEWLKEAREEGYR